MNKIIERDGVVSRVDVVFVPVRHRVCIYLPTYVY